MNNITLAGRLGTDPEVRFTPSGQKVTSFSMATNSRKGGKDETTWWRITVWGERLDKMIQYLKKGSAVITVGELHKPEIYTDRNGNSQVSMEVTAEILKFSPFGKGQQEGNGETNYQAAPTSNSFESQSSMPESAGVAMGTGPDSMINDEEIPF
jgi:single-strand DNA-binding protein